jgi:hypothetical protein
VGWVSPAYLKGEAEESGALHLSTGGSLAGLYSGMNGKRMSIPAKGVTRQHQLTRHLTTRAIRIAESL